MNEVGLFDDAQTVIILAFIHGRFHSIRRRRKKRRSDHFLVFKWIEVDSKTKENEVDRLFPFDLTLLSFMTYVNKI